MSYKIIGGLVLLGGVIFAMYFYVARREYTYRITEAQILEKLSEKLDEKLKRPMIKSNGALIYQQLFNGKILILVSTPHIEGYGEPRPPRTVEILRPDELKKPFIYRHIEIFLKDVTEWEDYDDDAPQEKTTFTQIGFNLPAEDEG